MSEAIVVEGCGIYLEGRRLGQAHQVDDDCEDHPFTFNRGLRLRSAIKHLAVTPL